MRKERMRKLGLVVLGAVLIIYGANVSATTINCPDSQDAWGKYYAPSGSHDSQAGNSDRMRTYARDDRYVAFVQFDLSSLSGYSASDVTSATLKIYCHYFGSPSTGAGYGVRYVASSWNEADYTTAGVKAPTRGDLITDVTNTSTGWHEINVTAAVKAWLDGSKPNYGLMLDADAYGHRYKQTDVSFWTKESNYNLPPQLIVDVVPEPATIGLLTMGTLGFMRRR